MLLVVRTTVLRLRAPRKIRTVPPDPEAIRSALAILGWSARMLAERVPCNPRRAQRWVSGAEPMPEAVWGWLEQLAALAERAPDRKAGSDA